MGKIVDTKKDKTEAALLTEARKRFRNAEQFEEDNRVEGLDDLRFKRGGLEQWPTHIVTKRTREKRPIITVNKLPVYTDRVIGDNRQNRTSIKIRPTGKESSEKTAKIFSGLIRNIEKESDADSIYQWGLQGAADSGRGAWRLVTDYIDDNVFEQEIRIKRIGNPYSVYFDPKYEDPTTKDCRYKFLTELIPKDEYEERYPGLTPSDFTTGGLADDQKYWTEGENVRIAEYWVKQPLKKKIYLLSDNRVVDGDKWDSVVDELKEKEEIVHSTADGSIEPGPATLEGEEEAVLNKVPEIKKSRTIDSHKVVMYLIDGGQVISGPHEWAGKYIPIVPVWGKEINIQGRRYYRGLIRNAKDPQKMYNYERTEEIERVALAKKPRTVMTHEQYENAVGWEEDSPQKVALYTHQPGVAPPIDTPPPAVSSGNVAQSAIANDEIKATIGMFDASLGARSNETSGRAISTRKNISDVGTFEFHDNLARAIKFTGDILVDLIPKIIDSERAIVVLGEDGSESFETVNQVIIDEDTGDEVILNDLSLGKYSTVVTVGPSFSSQRAETFQSLIEFAQMVPKVGDIGADLMARNLDFQGSQELADRLRDLAVKSGVIEDPDKEEGTPEEEKPDPETVKLQLEIQGKQLDLQGKQLDLKKKELEVQEQGLEVQEQNIELKQAMVSLEKIVAETRGSMAKMAEETKKIQVDTWGEVQKMLVQALSHQQGEGTVQ